jgi:hypothetical protein
MNVDMHSNLLQWCSKLFSQPFDVTQRASLLTEFEMTRERFHNRYAPKNFEKY